MIEIIPARSAQQMTDIFEIRRKVFVIEQFVDPKEEYDQFEESSQHFLAKYKGIPAGTCRFRETEYGIKLERFAVLKEYRGNRIGAELVKSCLEKIAQMNLTAPVLYLHAQTHAESFYAQFGFARTGDLFVEAEIEHYKMVLI
jgi:predicted GNAT family N-acyltransferase